MSLNEQIRVASRTKRVLEELKISPRETFDEVIWGLISDSREDKLELNGEIRKEIQVQIKRIAEGLGW